MFCADPASPLGGAYDAVGVAGTESEARALLEARTRAHPTLDGHVAVVAGSRLVPVVEQGIKVWGPDPAPVMEVQEYRDITLAGPPSEQLGWWLDIARRTAPLLVLEGRARDLLAVAEAQDDPGALALIPWLVDLQLEYELRQWPAEDLRRLLARASERQTRLGLLRLAGL